MRFTRNIYILLKLIIFTHYFTHYARLPRLFTTFTCCYVMAAFPKCNSCKDEIREPKNKVKCLSCEGVTCKSCTKTRLITSKILRCPNLRCKAKWDDEFIESIPFIDEFPECTICLDPVIKPKDKVECFSCGCVTCKDCTKAHLITSKLPYCSNPECKAGWDLNFLLLIFGVWINSTKEGGYRYHIKKLALDREKSKLPETMLRVPKVLEFKKAKKKITDCEREIEKMKNKQKEMNLALKNIHLTCDKKKKIREERKELIKKIKETKAHKWNLKGEIWNVTTTTSSKEKKEEKKITFICPCPRDECRGMINSSTFKCVVCEKGICRKCREKRDKEDGHKCDKNTIESVKLMRNDTKPCPKCATLIFKIAGCFDPETPILLYSGKIITAKDINVGDILLGDDGLPRVVEELMNGIDTMYQISQNKASDYIVNSQHKLVVKYSEEQANVHISEPIEITVQDFLKLHSSTKRLLKGYRSEGFNGFDNGGDSMRTSFQVTELGKGKYCGWRVSGTNKRFVLPDFTVVRNCDQMWCTECKTAFSWNTGNIETGTIHNPHAIRWMRKHGNAKRDINDIPCGGLVDIYHINTRHLTNQDRILLLKIHRIIAEIDYILRRNQIDNVEELNVIRREYVMGKITEKVWKQRIFIKERLNVRKKSNSDILVTLRTLSIERFRNIYENLNLTTSQQKSSILIKAFFKDINEVRIFINETFQNELTLLGTKKPIQISEDWVWKNCGNNVNNYY